MFTSITTQSTMTQTTRKSRITSSEVNNPSNRYPRATSNIKDVLKGSCNYLVWVRSLWTEVSVGAGSAGGSSRNINSTKTCGIYFFTVNTND